MREGLLEFQQAVFLIFQACWSSSSVVFLIFSLAGVPAAPFFLFLALLEFQQGCFLIFQACWSSSSPIFLIFALAGVPAGHLFDFLSLLEFQQGCKGMMFFWHYPFRNTKLHQSPFCLCSVFVRLKDCAFSVSRGTSSV